MAYMIMSVSAQADAEDMALHQASLKFCRREAGGDRSVVAARHAASGVGPTRPSCRSPHAQHGPQDGGDDGPRFRKMLKLRLMLRCRVYRAAFRAAAVFL